MVNQEKIGKFILKLRKENNMSQLELAERIGVTDRAISKWENGKGLPDISLMHPLCKALGITINDLLSGEKVDDREYQEKLEENILNTIKYSNDKVIKSILFYIATFFSGVVVVPTLGIIAPTFIVCGILVPLSGCFKFIGHALRFNIPFINYFIGYTELSPSAGFVMSLVVGCLLYFLGNGAWKLLVKYLNYIKNVRMKLQN